METFVSKKNTKVNRMCCSENVCEDENFWIKVWVSWFGDPFLASSPS